MKCQDLLVKKNQTLSILRSNEDPVKSNILYTHFNSKLAQIEDLTEEEKELYKTRVEDEIRTSVFDAYNSLILYFEALKPKATTDAGVWKLPDGDDFYQYQLSLMTTTDYTPEQVHQIGLSEVGRIKTEMRDILTIQGYTDTTKTLGEIIQELNKEERFLYQNNDEGRKEIIEGYNNILDEINDGLDNAFDIRPRASMEVKRIPEFKEEGSAKVLARMDQEEVYFMLT